MQTLTDRKALIRNRLRSQNDALFLHRQAAEDLQDRLSLVNRSFTSTAVVTGHPDIWQTAFPNAQITEDTEVLPLQAGAYDLVVHAMALHWANDPVGQIIQCARALSPDGLFIAVFPGGRTLHELRAVLAEAEAAVSGGLSPRVLPMGEIRDLGGLLQRAGLALPVADTDTVTATYPSMLHLMQELRAMGEASALNTRPRNFSTRALFAEAARRYSDAFAKDDRIPATFELIWLTGWAPSENQPQPLRPGSATARLAAALGAHETPLPGDK